MKKYSWPDMIPDEVIKDEFEKATEIIFPARNFNALRYANISFGDFESSLPLKQVLPIIGITPQVLRPVFNQQRVLVNELVKTTKKVNLVMRWLKMIWALLSGKKYEDPYVMVDNWIWKGVELPAIIDNYDQLSYFPTSRENFLKLAKIFGKPICVTLGHGDGWFDFIYTAYPSGEIVDAPKKTVQENN